MLALVSGALLTLSSCSSDDGPVTPDYTVPATYDFAQVNNTDAVARVSMWAGFTSWLGKGASRELNSDTANYLWNNTNTAFTAEIAGNLPYKYDALNTMTISLATEVADATQFKAYADSMVNLSEFYATPAAPGIAGKIGNRLVNHSGLEFNQAVAKGLMGALVLKNVYQLLDKVPTDDNTLTSGAPSEMQQDWDLAFGYIGVPKNYDTAFNYSTAPVPADRPLAIGGYFGERGKYIQAGGRVFEAFRTGRAAIGAKDYSTRDQAISTIKEYTEKTLAAAAYYYLTASQTQSDLAAKFHSLSEGYGFVLALKYRAAGSKLTATQYTRLKEILETPFYDLAADANNTDLKEAAQIFTTAYGQLQP
ncbi:hypothetical protein FPE01S_04_01050 [Flavihumibacter petaseus NBRC 106054]|uniref:DUF4856 domain-containing protein n=2 Tax=Flavihumibacter TaxID=1004301 RepID=A0A0E9N4I3_9BACT|nr:hypothetical protein FPE01S_04_01050 [Flavihumibacter petaseus NBRC 106054]